MVARYNRKKPALFCSPGHPSYGPLLRQRVSTQVLKEPHIDQEARGMPPSKRPLSDLSPRSVS